MDNYERLEGMGYKFDYCTRQMVMPEFYNDDFKYESKMRTIDIETAPNYPIVITLRDLENMTEVDFEKLALVLSK